MKFNNNSLKCHTKRRRNLTFCLVFARGDRIVSSFVEYSRLSRDQQRYNLNISITDIVLQILAVHHFVIGLKLFVLSRPAFK